MSRATENGRVSPRVLRISAESHILCFEEINDLIGTDLMNATAVSYHWMSGGEVTLSGVTADTPE